MIRKSTMFRANLLAAVVAASLAAPAATAAGNPAPAAPAAQAGSRLIIQYRDGKLPQSLKLQTVNTAANRARQVTAATARSGSTAPTSRYVRRLGIGADLLKLSNRLSAAELNTLVRELSADPAVKSVEVDLLMRHTGMAAPLFTPNDPGFAGAQWHMHNAVGGINAPAAWDVATGTGVVVAVIDTGIVAHPDMDANMLQGYDFISDSFVSRRPTNERVPGAHDYGDWNDDAAKCTVSGSSFHGTHVAGTVAELTNNSLGVAGVAHNARVLPVRVLGRCGGYTSDIVDAITWASGGTVAGVPANANPAEVINMSLGGGGSCGVATQTAINGAVSRGTTVVVAAGNSNGDVANFNPASCNNVIAVAAGRVTGGRASYSNYGALIDLTAPGGGGSVDGNPNGYIWQARNSSATSPELGAPSYNGFTGTSMASPHVAGVVALIQSAVATPKTPAEIETILKSSVRSFPATPDRVIGAGLLDAKRALDVALTPPGEAPPATVLVNKVAVSGVSGATGSSTMYRIDVAAGATLLNLMTYGGTGNASVYVSRDVVPTTTVSGYRSVRPGNTETVRISNPAAGTYYVLVAGTAAFANLTIQARID